MHRSCVLLPLLLCTAGTVSGTAQSSIEQNPTIPLAQIPSITFRFQPTPKKNIANRALHFPVPVLNFDRDLTANACYTMRNYHFQNDPNRPESPAFTGLDTCQPVSEAQLKDAGIR